MRGSEYDRSGSAEAGIVDAARLAVLRPAAQRAAAAPHPASPPGGAAAPHPASPPGGAAAPHPASPPPEPVDAVPDAPLDALAASVVLRLFLPPQAHGADAGASPPEIAKAFSGARESGHVHLIVASSRDPEAERQLK